MGYTGETAEYFQLFHVTSRVEKFEADLKRRRRRRSDGSISSNTNEKGEQGKQGVEDCKDGEGGERTNEKENLNSKEADVEDAGAVKELFPFCEFFKNAPAGEMLFAGRDLEEDLEVARGCFRHVSRVRASSFAYAGRLSATESEDFPAWCACCQLRIESSITEIATIGTWIANDKTCGISGLTKSRRLAVIVDCVPICSALL